MFMQDFLSETCELRRDYWFENEDKEIVEKVGTSSVVTFLSSIVRTFLSKMVDVTSSPV